MIYKMLFLFKRKSIAILSASADSTLTLLKTITTSFNCGSISHMYDGTFLVSSLYDPRPIRTIDSHDKEEDIHHIQLPDKTYTIGRSACSYIPSSKTVLFSDRDQNTVYMCNYITGEVCETKDNLIREPRGLCLGPQDTVFVCSADTGCIVQLSAKGDVLKSHNVNMSSPRAVTMSKDATLLAVSNSVNGQQMIKLFQIEL